MRNNSQSTSTTRLRNVDLNLLKVLDAVLREQNISKAATMLCVSQPAVSNALRRLRELYNDPLFIRTSSGMLPTPKAQELAEPISTALSQIDKSMLAGSHFSPETSQRVFHVVLTDYGEFFFLPEIIKRLKQQAPSVEVVCLRHSGASLPVEMRSGAVDLVWDWVEIENPEYIIEPVFNDNGYCLARKDHPCVDGEISLESFLELEHVGFLPTRNHMPKIERTLDQLGLDRTVVTEVSSLLASPSVVSSTDLIATMPARLAKYFAKSMGLQAVPNPIYQDSVTVYQMWHKHYEQDEGHKWFRELVKEVAMSV